MACYGYDTACRRVSHRTACAGRNDPVRHRMLVAGRAELVGSRWLAVRGGRYLRERGGGRSHRLLWFNSAQDAAEPVARRYQDQWTRRGDSMG